MSDIIKPAASAAVEIVHLAKDNPDAQRAGQNVAASLATVTQLVRNTLLPLAVINYGIARAEKYFTTKFAADIGEKTASIPDESLVAPKASVAGPALQGLAFSFDEDALREMYTSLLASAMDGRDPDLAHPSFAEIIKQLDAEEASMLGFMWSKARVWPIVRVTYVKDGDSPFSKFFVITEHLLNIQPNVEAGETDDDIADYTKKNQVWIDNWQRLGLITVSYENSIAVESQYDWINGDHRFQAIAAEAPAQYSARPVHGSLRFTKFGDAFARAVGMKDEV